MLCRFTGACAAFELAEPAPEPEDSDKLVRQPSSHQLVALQVNQPLPRQIAREPTAAVVVCRDAANLSQTTVLCVIN